MATSSQLRKNTEQHKPKNTHSKRDDKLIYRAQYKVQEYLCERFKNEISNYSIELYHKISFDFMYNIIKQRGIRKDYDWQYKTREIKPDGGVLVLTKNDDEEYIKILLIAEVKRQGTNDDRQKEGKQKQAQGNAIERLGKNLIGIRAMLQHEPITPFVCFCWGCDFAKGKNEFVPSKLSMMNEFYSLNRIYVNKQDGDSNYNRFSPVSIFHQKSPWTVPKMFNIMKEIAEDAIRHYLH